MKKLIAIAALATLCATSAFAAQTSSTVKTKQPTGKYMMMSSTNSKHGKYKHKTYYKKPHHKHSCGCKKG